MPATFNTAMSVVGEIYFFRMTATEVGDFRILESAENIRRIDTSNAVLITKGGLSYTSSNSEVPVTTIMAGDTSDYLPDFRVGETFRIEALTDDTEFFCMNRAEHTRFSYDKFSVKAGELYVVPLGQLALIGSGSTNKGVAPFIVHAETKEVGLVFDTQGFGLLLSYQ